MTLSAEELRTFVKEELERRDWNPSFCSRRCPHPDGSTGISRQACYLALKASGEKRVGTLVRMAIALGYNVEETYSLRDLGITERRRLHDKNE
jgi:hypothetical protein